MSLAEYVLSKSQQKLDEQKQELLIIKHMVKQMLKATKRLQPLGFAPRDIKPENIPITADGKVKITTLAPLWTCAQALTQCLVWDGGSMMQVSITLHLSSHSHFLSSCTFTPAHKYNYFALLCHGACAISKPS